MFYRIFSFKVESRNISDAWSIYQFLKVQLNDNKDIFISADFASLNA